MKVRDILKDCPVWMPSQDYESAKPTVSVLLPTFRRAKNGMFEAAVQSVLNQDFKNLELIIIDDASTDGTADLIAHFMKVDPRVSCIRHQFNIGLPAISEYEGYMKARGEYIAFIFDDNEWERDYLSKTINFMVRNQAKASFGRVRSYYAKEAFIELGVSSFAVGLNTLPYNNIIANGGVILSREVIEHVGLYDPHVVMTRLCDWNLWKRIVKKYEFYETGILAGVENGATQSDSLGNSYKMSSWAAAERESTSCDEMFLPQHFEDIEINTIPEVASEYYCNIVNSFYQEYRKKPWFKDEFTVGGKEKPRRILIFSSLYDATTDLSFVRLAKKSKNIVFKFSFPGASLQDIVQADAVILIRNLVVLGNIKTVCKKLDIPCYLYLDDNFIELANDYKNDSELKQLKDSLCFEKINQLDGILTSTDELKRYFEKLYLNTSIVTMPPCMGDLSYRETSPSSEPNTYVMAYMGGPFRDKTFLTSVVPALVMLSSKYKIKLLCPSRVNLDLYKKVSNLEIIQIKNTLSLESALMSYGKHHPHFLIHCGSKIKNNRYKTENSLINSVQLGAILVASDTIPYSEQNGKTCICSENTVEDWYKTLENLILDDNRQYQIFENAKHHCDQNYVPENALTALENILSGVQVSSMFQVLQRHDAVIFDLQYSHSMALAGVGVAASKPSRALGVIPLSFTGGLTGQRKYKIKCQSDTFSELGICFASFGEVHGKAIITINDSNHIKLRECVFSMEEFVHDNWTYLEFAPIENPKGQVFEIVMDFEYEYMSSQIGVFEDARKRTFMYRLLKKLGYRMNVQDLLFADCR